MVVIDLHEHRQDAEEWTDEAKAEWLAAQGSVPTHVVTFRPLVSVEVVVPPWESAEVRTARAAVAWAALATEALKGAEVQGLELVAVHGEQSSHWTAPIAGLPARSRPA